MGVTVQATVSAKSGSNCVRTGIESTWAAAREQTTGSTTTYVQASKPNSNQYQVGRYFGNFDVTASGGVPQYSKVTAVTFVHPAVSNLVNTDTQTVYVVDHSAADPVVSADFNNIDLNSDDTYGSAALSTLGGSPVNITLDANGIAIVQTAVSTGGLAKLGLRIKLDVDNTSPSGNNQYTINVTAAQLVIDYVPPSVLIFA